MSLNTFKFTALILAFLLLPFNAPAENLAPPNPPKTSVELKALKTENPLLYREYVAEIKTRLQSHFEELQKEKPHSIEHFRREFRNERVRFWQSKQKQYKETFQAYLNTQRNALYRQLEFLEFRKPKEYQTIMEQIAKSRPDTLKDLDTQNEKFTRAKQRMQERDERIRALTQEREQSEVAVQRRNDIVAKLRARAENKTP